ncbi:MAG TPA: FAD-binding oxidoreductase [Acidimicrobiia bacterium]|nr:FAD-binding oxidoreductase [Acidimicrobiia bacterium]
MKAGAVVAGAGIAGVSAAFHLARAGVEDVVIVDPRPPLSLTSDKSTECYRNWWPNQPMAGLMNRSIDLLEQYAEESNYAFHLNQRGYLFVTAQAWRAAALGAESEQRSHLQADFYADGPSLRRRFPYLTEAAVAGLHARRAGWFSAQQLGAYMLASARLLRGEVTGVETEGGRVVAVKVGQGDRLETPIFVNAAGPMLAPVGRLLDVDLPVYSELHLKVGFRDPQAVIPRDAPMLIWSDPQTLFWSSTEAHQLEVEGRTELLGTLPPGCHGRPEGGADSPWILALWEYHRLITEPVWPLPQDALYPEVVMKGLSTMVPGLAVYLDRLPQPFVDGGYYTKTRENRPLIGPLPVDGAYVLGALSGFGVMAAAAAGELVALHAIGGDLPPYAPAFALGRYDDPAYLSEIETLTESGQI